MEIVVYAQLSSACIPGYDPKASDLFEPVTVLAVLPPPTSDQPWGGGQGCRVGAAVTHRIWPTACEMVLFRSSWMFLMSSVS